MHTLLVTAAAAGCCCRMHNDDDNDNDGDNDNDNDNGDCMDNDSAAAGALIDDDDNNNNGEEEEEEDTAAAAAAIDECSLCIGESSEYMNEDDDIEYMLTIIWIYSLNTSFRGCLRVAAISFSRTMQPLTNPKK